MTSPPPHTLEDLEDIAYSVIGQYLIICLHLLESPAVTDQVRALTEKARVVYLLRERSRTYPLTATLLSTREHLLLYRHRQHIVPDSSERRFLFLNYLAAKGPCFHWIRDGDADALEWAWKFYESPPNDEIKKNAIRYLLRHNQKVPLQSLVDTFDDYNEKVELARYLATCARPQNKGLLFLLASDRREEVALEAKRLIGQLRLSLDARIKTLAHSFSDSKVRLLRMSLPFIAKATSRSEYRSFPRVLDASVRALYAYCLGEVGEEADLPLLTEVLSRKRLDNRLRMACWYALARICSRFGHTTDVAALLRKRRPATIILAVLDGITREGIDTDLTSLGTLLRRNSTIVQRTSATLLRVATKRDRAPLRRMLRAVALGNHTRDLLLALCKVGNSTDCQFTLGLVGRADRPVQLFNHVRVAESVASICGPSLRRQLRRHLNSPEFWVYIQRGSKRGRNRLPLKDIDNQALIRRLLGACFIRVATPKDVQFLKRLLSHNYDWIAMKAAERFGEFGNEKDLIGLNEQLLALKDLEDESHAPLLQALCILDRKLHGGRQTRER